MKPSLYIETSVISFLTARPSANVVSAARQLHTQAWWQGRDRYELFVSSVVRGEAALGDDAAAAARLHLLDSIQMVEVSGAAQDLARVLLRAVPLPEKAATDALHIAVAATAGAQILLTWNFKHIANPTLRERIATICRSEGYSPPILCSPEELLAHDSP